MTIVYNSILQTISPNYVHIYFKHFSILLPLLIFTILGFFYFVDENKSQSTYYAPLRLTTKYSLMQMQEFAYKNSIIQKHKPYVYVRWNYSFNKIYEDDRNRFNINNSDVIVFIHIQKTAGTSFERFLVKHLDIVKPCVCNMGKKRCNCVRPNNSNEHWLFSRYSTGWQCGLHADFTELFVSGCVEHVLDKKEGILYFLVYLFIGKHQKRRYFYTTFLREPIERFISEFSHVKRGANWLAARHVCNGKTPTPEQLPMCFNPVIGWTGVELDEFLSCPYNLAFNRQTRMLADLSLVNCYNTTAMDYKTRDNIILESAKSNLRNLAFFGIKERMADSQFLFKHIFHLKFNDHMANWNKSKSQNTTVSETQLQFIRQHNYLDVQLYKFALKLFDKRVRLFIQNTSNIVNENTTSSTFATKQTVSNLYKVTRNHSINIDTLKKIYKT